MEKDCLKVVMFPWLAHGHISPFLELAKAMLQSQISYNFRFYIISTPENLSSIANKVLSIPHSIQLVELHLHNSPDLPPSLHTTNGLPVRLQPALRRALRASSPDISQLIAKLQPDIVIHDFLQPWARSLASHHNVPSVGFFTSGAAMLAFFLHLGAHPGNKFPFPAMQLDSLEMSMALGYMESYLNEDKDPNDDVLLPDGGVMLMNTSRATEGKYLDYLSKLVAMKITPVGGLVQDPSIGGDSGTDLEIMEWLGEKEERSTVLVSFGSEYFLTREDIIEIASGLELSVVNFIWILRFPKGEEVVVEEALPEGFLERVGERGRIVEKWAPQAMILTHSSVGGFVSHCGWNSLHESIDFGVPMIAVPMHLDQPLNARLAVELGVGVEVKRDDEGRLKREEISKVIKNVVIGKHGEELRKGIGEQRERIRLSCKDEIEEVARAIAQLCEIKAHQNNTM